jgi:hypothetical protein
MSSSKNLFLGDLKARRHQKTYFWATLKRVAIKKPIFSAMEAL